MASIVSFVCHENVTITRGLNGEKHPKGLPGLVFSSVSALPSTQTALSNSRNAVSFSSACTTKRFPSSRCDYGQHCSLNRWIQTALSNSTNALSFSSECTIKRLPSSRCASTIQIVRPCVSSADTQPQLHPALLRLSAMISQSFMRKPILPFCSPNGNDRELRRTSTKAISKSGSACFLRFRLIPLPKCRIIRHNSRRAAF